MFFLWLTLMCHIVTMFKIIVKARVFLGALLSAGEHKVVISEIAETVSKPSDNWKDQTPQIEVKFKGENDRVLTHWFQLKGYKQAKDYPNGKAPAGFAFRSSENGNEQYAVNIKTGNRVEDPAKTATCMNILGEFAATCGIAEETEINSTSELIEALQGAELGIKVRSRADDKVEYHYSMPVENVKSSSEAEA